MTLSPFPESAPDFNDPLGLLRACHERILQQCATLDAMVEHLRAHGVDSEVRGAASKVHHYFSTAGRLHHQDEDLDLFPRLARQSLKLADLVHRLRQEHSRLDALWLALSEQLAVPSRITDLDGFAVRVAEFTALQRAHVARENEDLLPIAQHILSRDDLARLGKQMAERRGRPAPF